MGLRKGLLIAGMLMLVIALSAQAVDQPSNGKGMYITAKDIKGLLATQDLSKMSDTVMHLIDANVANVGVALVHRPSNPSVNNNYLQHSHVIEIYYVLDGGATMTIGGTLTNAQPFPPAGQETISVGPGFRGTGAASGGQTRTIGPGDIVVVPAGATHYFSSISDMTYLVFRVDPSKQTKLID